jgi:hydrogenase large subunit
MEVGPLARTLVAYASGNHQIKKLVDNTLNKLNLPATTLYSTLGRVAARTLEADFMVGHLSAWVQQLDDNMPMERSHPQQRQMGPGELAEVVSGFGLEEAPRGSLGHCVEIENKKIVNYQSVVPSTWNAGPRDAHGQSGAYEAALLKTPVADPERPLEILRRVHSFDPCLACAVHVVDASGRQYSRRQLMF